MVGPKELVVRLRDRVHLHQSSLCSRTWALILGMTGLIVLFWFVGGGVALRYFVSVFLIHLRQSVYIVL